MKTDMQQVIGLLQNKGEHQQAEEVERELAQKVDPDAQQDTNLLRRLGVDPMALARKFLDDRGIACI